MTPVASIPGKGGPAAKPKQRTVLLVDDKQDLLEPIAAFLEMRGYQARLAANVEQAIESIATGGAPYALVTDKDIPPNEKAGLDMLARTAHLRPLLRILHCSDASSMIGDATAAAGGNEVIPFDKPASPKNLAAFIVGRIPP